MKLKVFVMTKAVSNREIGFIKAVLLLCEHWHLKEKKIEYGVFTFPHTIRVNKIPPSKCLLPSGDQPRFFGRIRKRLAVGA